MSGLKLHVSGFGGHSVEALVREMTEVAARLGMWVTCDINGIHVMASPDDSADVLWRNFETAMARKVTFVSANVVPQRVSGPPDGPDIPAQPLA